jgi:hypothetical protein
MLAHFKVNRTSTAISKLAHQSTERELYSEHEPSVAKIRRICDGAGASASDCAGSRNAVRKLCSGNSSGRAELVQIKARARTVRLLMNDPDLCYLLLSALDQRALRYCTLGCTALLPCIASLHRCFTQDA